MWACTKSLSFITWEAQRGRSYYCVSSTVDSTETRDGKCIKVTGIKQGDWNLKSELRLLATTYLKNSQESPGHRLKTLNKGSE